MPKPPGTCGEGLHEPLQRYLRTLWPQAPALRYAAASPRIVGGTIQLPAERPDLGSADRWRWYCAAAAHAAAHLALSPAHFDGSGLPPITRALLALLEDARVEALACRELPGLRRLWAALHRVKPGDGDDFETLMLRLARCLIDPAHDDPHPWVQKGRRLFYVDPAAQILALRRPDELRWAASVLGHDIGQMRLPFNARLHVPGPDYRDDSRWMWPAEQAQAAPPSEPAPGGGTASLTDTPALRSAGWLYPEWDRLIARLRQDWCTVYEEPVAADPDATRLAPAPEMRRLRDRLLVRIRPRPLRPAGRPLRREGHTLDIDALVRWRIALARHEAPDDRLYRRLANLHRRVRLLIVVDQSASSASAWGSQGMDRLQAACRVAALLAGALQRLQQRVAIVGFSSDGRHAVAVRPVLGFDEALCPAGLQRLAGLRSAHSTRLGAALRHGAQRLALPRDRAALRLLFISDGEPYDVDVHDPRYLLADARQAVASASRRGIQVQCIVLDAAGLAAARQVFGARQAGLLASMAALPALAGRLGL